MKLQSHKLSTIIAVGGTIILFVAACTGGPAPSPHAHGISPRPSQTNVSSELAREGLEVPATYQAACASEAGSICSPYEHGQIPLSLTRRPLRLPTLSPGQSCLPSSGHLVNSVHFSGVALGSGPVQVIIAGVGDVQHGIIDLLRSYSSNWRGTKTLWFSMPSYQGPFIIRAKRLDGSSMINIDSASDGPSSTPGPLVVPPGPTLNSQDGWREAPGGTWVTAPGCYGWQVDGLTFSEVIAIRFACVAQFGCPPDFGSSRK